MLDYMLYVLHAVGSLLFTFGCYYDWKYTIVPEDVVPIMSAYGGKLKFLTYWNALMQAMYFTFCVVVDIGGWDRNRTSTKHQPIVSQVRDYIFTSLGFPIALFVSFTFWGLYAVDRELVLPKFLDPYFPKWLNHIMHTCVGLWVIAEMILCHHIYPDPWKGLLGLAIFQSSYLVWMHIVHMKSGLWVYNVFNVLSLPQRILFLLASVGTGCLFWLLGNRLNAIVWGNDKRLKTQKKKK